MKRRWHDDHTKKIRSPFRVKAAIIFMRLLPIKIRTEETVMRETGLKIVLLNKTRVNPTSIVYLSTSIDLYFINLHIIIVYAKNVQVTLLCFVIVCHSQINL
jgi:hypothetical protein